MSILSIIIICSLVFFTLLGGGIGTLKGFIKVKSWAVELVFVGAIGIPIGKIVTSKMSGGTPVPGFITLGITLFLAVLFMAGFIVLRTVMARETEKRSQKSYYEHYDEITDNEERILTAVNAEDKKQYKQLLKSKRKIKRSRGVWGILDRVFGGVALAVKGAALTGLFAAIILSVIDFSRLAQSGGALYAFAGKIYTGGAWKFFRGCFFDFFVIGIIMLCIRSGYENGITSTLWGVFIICLIAGAGLLSWRLASGVAEFKTVADNLAGNLSDKLSSVTGILEKVKITPVKLAQIIIAAGLFALMLSAVIIAAAFGPKLIDKARDGLVFRTADGVLGAVITTVIVVGLLLVLGAVLNSLHGYAFMNAFNVYFEKSGVATHIYDRNILNAMGVLKISFAKWLG